MAEAIQAWADLKPRLAEAAREERRVRGEAWHGLPLDICGISVHPLSLRLYGILSDSGNAFVVGSDPAAADIMQFLWIVSTDFAADPKARDVFIKQHQNIGAIKAIIEIRDYLAAALLDAPRASGGSEDAPADNKPLQAYLVHQFADAYGWDADKTLDQPMARLFQLRLMIGHASGGPKFDRPLQDAVKAEFLTQTQGAN